MPMSKRRIQRKRQALITTTAIGVVALAAIAFYAVDVIGVLFVGTLCLVALSAGRLERIETLVPILRRIDLLEKGILPAPASVLAPPDLGTGGVGECKWCSVKATHKVRTIVFDLAGSYRGEQSCYACDEHVGGIAHAGVGLDVEA
jgi:hypothetical protein